MELLMVRGCAGSGYPRLKLNKPARAASQAKCPRSQETPALSIHRFRNSRQTKDAPSEARPPPLLSLSLSRRKRHHAARSKNCIPPSLPSPPTLPSDINT